MPYDAALAINSTPYP